MHAYIHASLHTLPYTLLSCFVTLHFVSFPGCLPACLRTDLHAYILYAHMHTYVHTSPDPSMHACMLNVGTMCFVALVAEVTILASFMLYICAVILVRAYGRSTAEDDPYHDFFISHFGHSAKGAYGICVGCHKEGHSPDMRQHTNDHVRFVRAHYSP